MAMTMGLYSNSSHIFFYFLYFLSRQGEACTNKTDAGKTPRSDGLRGVRLRSVLATLGFSEMSLTLLSVSHFGIFGNVIH